MPSSALAAGRPQARQECQRLVRQLRCGFRLRGAAPNDGGANTTISFCTAPTMGYTYTTRHYEIIMINAGRTGGSPGADATNITIVNATCVGGSPNASATATYGHAEISKNGRMSDVSPMMHGATMTEVQHETRLSFRPSPNINLCSGEWLATFPSGQGVAYESVRDAHQNEVPFTYWLSGVGCYCSFATPPHSSDGSGFGILATTCSDRGGFSDRIVFSKATYDGCADAAVQLSGTPRCYHILRFHFVDHANEMHSGDPNMDAVTDDDDHGNGKDRPAPGSGLLRALRSIDAGGTKAITISCTVP